MFTVQDRERTQTELIRAAEADDEIIGAALVGSSATGEQDSLSDIDLMLQLSPDADDLEVIDRWTALMYADHGVVHHLDVRSSAGVLYRVFLTAESLQIDLSFWPHDEFRSMGGRFRLLFGTPNETPSGAKPSVNALIGEAWLFALHIRSALRRTTPWYATSLIDTMRIRIMEMASIRHGLNPHQRREVDRLPPDYLAQMEQTYPASITPEAIQHAFAILMNMYANEIAAHDVELLTRLNPALDAIIEGSQEDSQA